MRKWPYCLGFMLLWAALNGAVAAKLAAPKTSLDAAPIQWDVTDTVFENTPYMALSDVDSLLGASGKWVPDRQKWVSRDKQGRSWVFTLDNSFCTVVDGVFNLTYPVRRSANRLWVPVYPLLRLLKDQAKLELQVLEAPAGVKASSPNLENASSTGPNGKTVLGPVECEARGNGTLVRIAALGPIQPEILWVPPHYLARFDNAELAKGMALRQDGKGLVDKVIFNADPNQIQMTLQIRGEVDTIEMERMDHPRGLQFLVRKVDGKKAKTVAGTKEKNKKGTIIIDPGHGGHDQGAIINGVKEAQITLAVGKQLKKALEKLGYKALMTREDDTYVSLADRPKFASEKGGDLFVSLHCNSMEGTQKRKQQVSGFTVYILREGESEEDNALARRENEAIQEEKGKTNKSEISPVDWILLEHQLNLYSKQSETFAEKIIKAFDGFEIQKYSTGARQAGFFVLVGAYMPAVLFEMGFLTNSQDRAFMASANGQKRMAKQLSEAIDQFMSYRQND
jgi:N-acetylmuramoyl-L-alanine amidase